MRTSRPNHPASGKAGIASPLTIGHHCPGLPDPERWPVKILPHLCILVVLASISAYGQGAVHFRNLGSGLDAPVRNASGELVPPFSADRSYGIELVAGVQADALAAVAVTAVFSTPGYFGLTDSVWFLPGMAPGSHPWFQVICWRTGPGVWPPFDPPPILEVGMSEVFQLDPAGPGLGETGEDAPDLRGLTPFQLRLAVTLSVALEEGNVVVRWEADPRLPLCLERATSVAGTWAVLSNAVSPYAEPTGSGSPVYFRVVALGEGLQANQAVEATQPRPEVSDD
jgi:hypothetical protein